MSDSPTDKANLKPFRAVQRRPITVTQEALVKTEPLNPSARLPLLMRPAIEGVVLADWVAGHRQTVIEHLLRVGAILFRGFDIPGPPQFEQVVRAISESLLDYTYGSTPRRRVSGKIYTSTEYPAEQSIPLHNEMAYSTEWPMKIAFYCLTPAAVGGETPIADSRRVYDRIDERIRKQFSERLVMYVRNYGDALDVPWQQVFQTTDKREVEDYCRRAAIEFKWRDGDRLRTRQVCQAVAAHPLTGEMVWFNQAHLFHISSLERLVRESLLSLYPEGELARNAYYGDGSPIEDSILDEIRGVYNEQAIAFPWQANDLLLLDNMLTAHGRKPYSGPRQVLVGMAEPYRNSAALY